MHRGVSVQSVETVRPNGGTANHRACGPSPNGMSPPRVTTLSDFRNFPARVGPVRSSPSARTWRNEPDAVHLHVFIVPLGVRQKGSRPGITNSPAS
jgi:hypothetical protein